MKIDLFESFDLNSKACIAWSKGICLGYRAEGHYYMSLYRIADFYVEIQYCISCEGIASVQTFAGEDEIEAYLNQIDISGIVS